MTSKPIATGISKSMFEASGAVTFKGGARSTRLNVVPVATVTLFSSYILHCSFIENCSNRQTITSLFAWPINVAILPSLIYLNVCLEWCDLSVAHILAGLPH